MQQSGTVKNPQVRARTEECKKKSYASHKPLLGPGGLASCPAVL